MSAAERSRLLDVSSLNTLTHLTFIAKIKEGEKLYKDLSLRQNTTYNSFLRRINGENRYTSLDFVTKTVEKGLYIYEKLDERDELSRMVYRLLIDSKNGINNLAKTYKDDRLFVSKVEILLAIMDTKLKSKE